MPAEEYFPGRASRRGRGRWHRLLARPIGECEQIVRQIGHRIVLAVATDQRLVVLAEIDAQAAPDAVVIVLAKPPLGEQRGHATATGRKAPLATRRRGILAARVSVADGEFQIVGDVVSKPGIVEEARLQVDGVDKGAHGRGLVAAALDAGNALRGPAPEIERTLAAILGDENIAHGAFPIGVGPVGAGQSDPGVAPEQMTGGGTEEAAVEAATSTVHLQAELATERDRHRALRSVQA